MTITVRNDFHNTSTHIRVPADGRISPAVVRRVRRELCPGDECTCGQGPLLHRGEQDDGWTVDYDFDRDGGAIITLTTAGAERPMVRDTFQLPRDVQEQIRERAHAERVSKSEVVRRALGEYL
jgi:hypothetical protein